MSVEGVNVPTAAKVAGAAGTAAAVGSLVYAVKTGKVADTFEGGAVKKGLAKAGDGYQQLGKTVAKKAGKVWKSVKDLAAKAKEALPKKAEKTAEAAKEVAGEIVE